MPKINNTLSCIAESEKIARAFLKACQHGTSTSYRARINIIGHSGAGKTSLTRRLLGQKFREKEQSTDGIETHRIEFDLDESDLGHFVWTEAALKTEQLSRLFNAAVLEKTETFAPNSCADVAARSKIKQMSSANASSLVAAEESGRETGSPDSHLKESNTEPLAVSTEILEKLKISAMQEMLHPDESLNVCKGILNLWDFGGQTEFYTTHHLFLDADAINIIVMDISKPLRRNLCSKHEEDKQLAGTPGTPEEFLLYWLRSVEIKASEKNMEPTILLVLTHKDKVATADNYMGSFHKDIKEFLIDKNLLLIPDENIFIVDNKNGHSAEFEQLRKCLRQVIEQQPGWGTLRPIRWLKLEADMKQTTDQSVTKLVKHTSHQEVLQQAEVYHMGNEELTACLLFLHSVGDLVWFPDEGLRDVIILDPQWLVDVFKILITSEQFIRKRHIPDEVFLLINYGIVSFTGLEKFWAGNDVRFLVEIMKKFGLILPLEFKSGDNFLVPSMLPPKKASPQKAALLKSSKAVYISEHIAQFDELFPIGTFAKLLAAFAKKWPVCEDEDLSQNFASLSLSGDTKLVLYQLHQSIIQISVWCQPEELEKHPLPQIIEITEAMCSIFHTYRIPPSELCQLICPNWRPGDTHMCTVEVLQESLSPQSQYMNIQYSECECVCHSKPLK